MGQSRSNQPFICGFSPFPRFKKYLHTPVTEQMWKITCYGLLKPSDPVTHSKSILSYFTASSPTDTDRVLAEANPAKDQLSYAVRTVWRPSWLLPHLKKKKKITVTDSKEVTRVISRLSARTLHVFQITLQHCTTKKYAEIFHLKWRLKIKH